MNDNTDYLLKCREAIEKKLSWGNSALWQNQDFENLGDRIFEETGVVLSASTLKRIWGKVQYNSKPNLSTLDALAQFAGFTNWRTFAGADVPRPLQIAVQATQKKSPYRILIPLGLVIAALVIAGFVFIRKQQKPLIYKTVHFTSQPVTTGVPNTVIFEYDAHNSNADSVFIQQSWDPKRKFRVDKQLRKYTSTYYMPGYYRAKLVLNDSIVKEHDVFVESNGWMGVINHEPQPIYLNEKIFTTAGQIGLSSADLEKINTDRANAVPNLILTWVSKAFHINSDNFLLTLKIQNTFNNAQAVCRKTSIMLMGTDGVILIPLSNIGCVGELGLMLGQKQISDTTQDLSGFGVDFQKPVQVACQSLNKKIKITVNNKTALEDNFDSTIGKIVGIRIGFEGLGYIRDFDLKPAR